MKRSEKKNRTTNEITVSVRGMMALATDPEEAAAFRALAQGVKCRGFILYCAIDSPDENAPGFVISHNVDLPEVAGAILQDVKLGAAAIHLARDGMLLTGPAQEADA